MNSDYFLVQTNMDQEYLKNIQSGSQTIITDLD